MAPVAPHLRAGDRVVYANRGAATVIAATAYRCTLVLDDGTRLDQCVVADARRTTYVRTNGGRTIHTAECHMARRGRAMPWVWAEGLPNNKIRRGIEMADLRCCRRCLPRAFP